MLGQVSLFDWKPEVLRGAEPEVGKFVQTHGAVICHIMRPGYIGRKIVIDRSNRSNRFYQVGILEDYIPYGDTHRSIVYVGESQRQLITHGPGVEIWECLPWEAYPERMKAIGRRTNEGSEAQKPNRTADHC